MKFSVLYQIEILKKWSSTLLTIKRICRFEYLKELAWKVKHKKIVLWNIKLLKIDSLNNSCQPDENRNNRVLNRTNSASRLIKLDKFSKEYRDNQKQKIKKYLKITAKAISQRSSEAKRDSKPKKIKKK